jgi:hypothetical protein
MCGPAIGGVIGSPAASAGPIAGERVASFLQIPCTPEVDGVSAHTEPARRFARGETLGEESRADGRQHQDSP